MAKFVRLAGALLIFLGSMTGIAAVTWGNTDFVQAGTETSCGTYWSPDMATDYNVDTGFATEVVRCPLERGNGGTFAVLLLLVAIGLVVFGIIAIAMTTGGRDESAEQSSVDDVAVAGVE